MSPDTQSSSNSAIIDERAEVVQLLERLVQNGQKLDEILDCLKKISQTLDEQKTKNHDQVISQDISLEMIAFIALLCAVGYGAMLWYRPYQIDREMRARVRAREEVEEEFRRREREELRIERRVRFAPLPLF